MEGDSFHCLGRTVVGIQDGFLGEGGNASLSLPAGLPASHL